MKRITVGILAAVVTLFCGIYAHVSLRNQIDRLAPKAEKFDAICSLAKTKLFLDRKRLDDPRLREPMLKDFAGYNIGDGYAMLEWCVPHAQERVAEVRRCTDDYACVERVFRTMEASIVP